MTENTNPIVYQAHLHWVLFMWPTVLLIGTFLLGYNIPQVREASWIMAGVALVWEAIIWVTYTFSSLIIKKKQIILRSGFLVRQTVDIPLNKIESVDIRQTILGSLLQYGSLVITGTGGSRQSMNFISKPLTCRRYIEQLMHD